MQPLKYIILSVVFLLLLPNLSKAQFSTAFNSTNVIEFCDSLPDGSYKTIYGFLTANGTKIKYYDEEGIYIPNNINHVGDCKTTSEADTLYIFGIDSVFNGFVSGSGTLQNCEALQINFTTDFTGSVDINGTTYTDTTLARLSTTEFAVEGYGKLLPDIAYDFTGAITANSVHVTSIGCQAVKCYTLIQVNDCATNEVVTTCNGWASASGVWVVNGRCINTGQ